MKPKSSPTSRSCTDNCKEEWPKSQKNATYHHRMRSRQTQRVLENGPILFSAKDLSSEHFAEKFDLLTGPSNEAWGFVEYL